MDNKQHHERRHLEWAQEWELEWARNRKLMLAFRVSTWEAWERTTRMPRPTRQASSAERKITNQLPAEVSSTSSQLRSLVACLEPQEDKHSQINSNQRWVSVLAASHLNSQVNSKTKVSSSIRTCFPIVPQALDSQDSKCSPPNSISSPLYVSESRQRNSGTRSKCTT